MISQRNHYEVLGVPATATTDQIKTKYRELARKFHPDVVKDKVLGQKVFTQINQAYRILADPERRAQYDASLRAGAPGAAQSAVPAQGAVRPNGMASTNNGAAPAGGPLGPQQIAAVARLISDADFALMNGDGVAAQTHCEAALKMDPQNAKALGLLGDALVAQKQSEAAAAAYRRSLQVAPSPMIQAKLSRLESTATTTRTAPPSANNGNGTRTTPPQNGKPGNGTAAAAAAPASGGLFGRLLGKRK